MNTVSILPPSIKEQRKRKQEISKFLYITSIISVVLLIFGIFIYKYRLSIENELSVIWTERQLVESKIEYKKTYVETMNKISELKKIVEKAMGDVPDWEKAINEISYVMPNDIYLVDIEASYTEEKFIILHGYSSTQHTINNFIHLLNEIELIDNTELIYINKL